MAIYHKNAIITGLLDSFCLVCEVHLQGEDELGAHLLEQLHRDNLGSTGYTDKFKGENIRKVPRGYYCEYCNRLFVTAMKLDMHLLEKKHEHNKMVQQLQASGGMVLAFNKLAMEEDAWHGLVNGSCMLCNTEYTDKEAHKSAATHILNLVQSFVEFGENGTIYRKGDDFFYCVTCNAIFSINAFKNHHEHFNHLECYKKCCEAFKYRKIAMILTNTANDTFENVSDDYDMMKKAQDSKESVGNLLKANVDNTDLQKGKDTEEKSAKKPLEVDICAGSDHLPLGGPSVSGRPINKKKRMVKNEQISTEDNKLKLTLEANQSVESEHCNSTENANGIECIAPVKEPNADLMSENNANISEKRGLDLLTDIESNRNVNDDEIRKKIAKENKIKYEEGAHSAFCSICNVNISSSLKRISEHVTEAAHKIKAKAVLRVTSKVKPTSSFIKVMTIVQNTFLMFFNLVETIEVVINDSFCVSLSSFSLMTRHENHVRCQLCEENMSVDCADGHRESKKHKEAFDKVPVFYSLKSEFVREVRPDLFHCGFCNIIEGSWTGLVDHGRTT